MPVPQEKGYAKGSAPFALAARITLQNKDQQTMLERMFLHSRDRILNIVPAPTLDQAFRNVSESGLKVVGDNNLEPDTIGYLEHKGFVVIAVGKTRAYDATDEYLYDRAIKQGAIIVTHDNDFRNRSRFNLRDSPGVVILPKEPHGPSSWTTSVPLRLALDHLSQNMPRSLDEWRSKIVQYRRDGTLKVYSLPVMPDHNGRAMPTVKQSGYFPQPSA